MASREPFPTSDLVGFPPPVIAFDPATQVVSIDHYRFSRELFAQFTASPLGVRFRILTREDGVLTVGYERDPLEAAAAQMLALLKVFAKYYELNDLQDRGDEDALEVPVLDLRNCFELVRALHSASIYREQETK